MPTDEVVRLLTLARERPLQALTTSDGVLQTVAGPGRFRAFYVPDGDSYVVIVNETDPPEAQLATVGMLVKHHVERHARGRTLMVADAFTDCNECAPTPTIAVPAVDGRRKAMRRLAANN